MGLASKWFRGLFGLKKSDSSPATAAHSIPKPPNRRWSFVKSYREKQTNTTNQEFSRETPNGNGNDTNKHAIAVAVATAAVAEAAFATAQAANAVVKLTSAGRSSSSKRGGVNSTTAAHASISGLGIREEYAAVKIQSIFRAYLSRRALKALKALVKLQALARGHFVRKRTSDMMRRMQALIRAQTRARIGRSQVSDSPLSKSSKFRSPYLTSPTILFEFESSKDPLTPEKIDHPMRAKSRKHQLSLLKRNSSKSYARDGPIDNEKGDKILEVDHTGKPQINPKRRNLFQPSSSEQNSHSHNRSQSHSFTTSRGSTIYQTVPSPSSCEVNSLSPLIYVQDLEEISFHTAGNTPHYYSASSKGNSWTKVPFTPSKSDRSRSCLSGYLDHPNYMSYTESSKAKVRSLSAPRQRTQSEISGVTKRYSLYGYGDSRLGPRRVSDMHVNFASKVYPGSGRLDRIGMPVGGGDLVGFSGEILNIY